MIDLSLTTKEAETVREACFDYCHALKEIAEQTGSERAAANARMAREIARQLADKVRLAN